MLAIYLKLEFYISSNIWAKGEQNIGGWFWYFSEVKMVFEF